MSYHCGVHDDYDGVHYDDHGVHDATLSISI